MGFNILRSAMTEDNIVWN